VDEDDFLKIEKDRERVESIDWIGGMDSCEEPTRTKK
jgi:hypothetical protein